jgi:hypothetical protein
MAEYHRVPSNATREALRWDARCVRRGWGAGAGQPERTAAPARRRPIALYWIFSISGAQVSRPVHYRGVSPFGCGAGASAIRQSTPEGSITPATKPQSSICGARILAP